MPMIQNVSTPTNPLGSQILLTAMDSQENKGRERAEKSERGKECLLHQLNIPDDQPTNKTGFESANSFSCSATGMSTRWNLDGVSGAFAATRRVRLKWAHDE